MDGSGADGLFGAMIVGSALLVGCLIVLVGAGVALFLRHERGRSSRPGPRGGEREEEAAPP